MWFRAHGFPPKKKREPPDLSRESPFIIFFSMKLNVGRNSKFRVKSDPELRYYPVFCGVLVEKSVEDLHTTTQNIFYYTVDLSFVILVI